MGGAHAAVAYYDLQALTAVQNIFNPSDTGPASVASAAAGVPDRLPGHGQPGAVGAADGGGRPGRRCVTRPLERDRAAQHPADRHRQAAQRGNLEHRHADRGEHRSVLPAGRDVQPAARYRRRPPAADSRPLGLRGDLRVKDQLALRAGPGPARPVPRRSVRGPQGHPELPLRDPGELLRGGRLHRLQDGRRRARRRHHQRPGPRGRRLLPRRQRHPAGLHPDGSPADEREPGPYLRSLPPWLQRLRPRVAPAASAPLPAPAGRLRHPHPAPARPGPEHLECGQDGLPDREASPADRPGQPDRHHEHPVRSSSRRRTTGWRDTRAGSTP